MGVARAIAILAIVLMLSACLDSPLDPNDGPAKDDPTPDPGTTPPPDPDPVFEQAMLLQFRYLGCTGADVRARVSAQAANDLLPEGFTARVVGTGPDGTAQTTARWRLFACDSFEVGGTNITEVVLGDVAVAIEAPERRFLTEADADWYRFRLLSDETNLGSAWETAGYDVVRGEATATVTGQSPLRQFHISMAGYSLQGIGERPLPASHGAGFHATQTTNGTLVWREGGSYSGFLNVDGFLSVPADDPLRSLVPERPGTTTYSWMDAVDLGPDDAWLFLPTDSG